MRRAQRCLIWLVLALVIGLTMATPAAAHAVLIESNPADGATIERAPSTITLRFNEPVSLTWLRLLDGDGTEITPASPAQARDAVVTLTPPDSLSRGWYVLSFRVVSLDSHPVSGSIAFHVGEVAEGIERPRVANEAATSHMVSALAWILRALRYGGILLAAGLAMQLALDGLGDVIKRRIIRALRITGTAAIMAGILEVGLVGATLAGDELAGIFRAEAWRLGASGSLGQSIGLALLGIVTATIAAGRNGRPEARLIATGGATIALVSVAVTGHASSAQPTWLVAAMIVIHAATAAFWLGALWPLLLSLRLEPTTVAAERLRIFSRQAVVPLLWLLASALLLAIIQLSRPGALVETDYGLLLLAKIGAVLGLLALASLNRWRLVPRLGRGEARAAHALKATIAIEFAVFAIVIALTAGLGVMTPPRALPAAPATIVRDLADGDIKVTLQMSPGHPGRNRVTLEFDTSDEVPRTPHEIRLRWSLPTSNIEPLERMLIPQGDQRYATSDVTVPIAGDWQFEIVLWRDLFTKSSLVTRIRVTP